MHRHYTALPDSRKSSAIQFDYNDRFHTKWVRSDSCYYCSLWAILTQRVGSTAFAHTLSSAKIIQDHRNFQRCSFVFYYIKNDNFLFISPRILRSFFSCQYIEMQVIEVEIFKITLLTIEGSCVSKGSDAWNIERFAGTHKFAIFIFLSLQSMSRSFLSRSVPRTDDPRFLSTILSNVPPRDSHFNRHSTIS